MYRRILVASRTPPRTARSSTHVSELARLTGAELLLVHVADGWAARNFEELKLRESEEMQADREYLGPAARRSAGPRLQGGNAAGDGRPGDRADQGDRGAEAST